MPAHLITGGQRSGKSAYAEALALRSERPVTLIATASAGDPELDARVALHRRRRPPSWRTLECPTSLAEAILAESAEDRCLIVDCLTLWIANLEPARIEIERTRLVGAIKAARALMLLVSNEVGAGVVPLGAETRWFVDEHGVTNQRLASVCERVTLMVCGVPLAVKS